MLVDPTVAFKCSADETITTINATAALLGFSDEASLDVAPGAPYTFTIEPLRQSPAVYAGYCVRISALNSAGFGVPTTRSCSRSPTEGGVPDAPVLVELMRVAGSWTTLRVFWAFVAWCTGISRVDPDFAGCRKCHLNARLVGRRSCAGPTAGPLRAKHMQSTLKPLQANTQNHGGT